MTTKEEEVVHKALVAFWQVVMQSYPQAEAGDLSPHADEELEGAALAAVSEWVELNVPKPIPYTATQVLKDRARGTTKLDDLKYHARDI